MANRFNLLVFDWDGTLMDSEARIVACIKAAIDELGLPARDTAAVSNIIGLGLREAVDTLFPGADDALHRDLTACYRHHFLEANTTPSTLFPGASEALRSLHQQGFLLAVATGKGRQGLDKVLAETGLGALFHATRCSDETCSKPDPQMLHELMVELDAAPEQTLMVGDTEYDMQMARNAGTGALAVSYGVHALGRLLRHEPLGHIHDITEFEPWLSAQEKRAAAG
jgi:phosphoglycolate phosphatase